MDYTPNPKFINNTVVDNQAKNSGGGLYLSAANVDIINCIIFSNSAPVGSQAQIYIQRSDWFPKIHFCSVQDGESGINSNGEITYENNVTFEPSFIDSEDLQYELSVNSKLIDLGTINIDFINSPWTGINGETIKMPSIDIIGNPRIYNGQIDIGAYESQSIASSINQYKNLNLVDIYPNPSDGHLVVKNNYKDYMKIKVYSIEGRMEYSGIISALDNKLDLTFLPKGIYTIYMESGNEIYTNKILITK